MILILDDFLSETDIDKLLNFIKTNKENYSHWYGTETVPFDQNFLEIGYKINSFVLKFNIQIDWGKIVLWPTNSFQPFHFDQASESTVFSSIIYLNDDYEGGQTIFEEGTMISPKKNRVLFFNGIKYKHGVNKIKSGERYTLAIWYKALEKEVLNKNI